ncbi:MAG: imidazole glycerol phosphate synthase subunit HisF [Chloroflexi bacterium]|nr:imidazole glycerol phosphate synthase subunit HisF [Chloroflexota bacterium]
MLTTRIIPCLDVHAGRVIRGQRFSADVDVGDPVELARRYNADGADELVYYDITASAERREIFLEVVERTADQLFIPLTVGGGIRTTDDIRRMLRAGADKVSLNSAAVADPSLIDAGARGFGSQCIVLSIDALWNGSVYEVYTHGGRHRTGRDAVEWAREGVRRGAGEIVVNSIDADGTRDGYELRVTRAIADAVSVPVVASGGAGKLQHLYEAIDAGHAHAVLCASIFHYGTHTIPEAKAFLRDRGVPVRLQVAEHISPA